MRHHSSSRSRVSSRLALVMAVISESCNVQE